MKFKFSVFFIVFFSSLMLQANQNEIEKIARKIHQYTQEKEDLSPLHSFNLEGQDLANLQNILALKLLDLEIGDAKFGSIALGGATIALGALSLGAYYLADALVSDNCPPDSSGCPDDYLAISDLCYEDGMNAECAEYYESFYNVSSIPPYPTYLEDCSDIKVPLTLLGKTIPYTTLGDICRTEKGALFSVPATTAVVGLCSLGGCIGHGCKYLYKRIAYNRQKKLCANLNMLDLLDKANKSAQPSWFKKVIRETKSFVDKLPKASELDSIL